MIELKAKTGDNDQENDGCDDPEIVKLMIEYFYHFDYLRKLPRMLLLRLRRLI